MCWVLWMFYVKGSHLGARSRIACPSNLFLFEPLHLTNQSLAGQVCAMFHVDSSNPPPHSKPLQTLSISGDTAPTAPPLRPSAPAPKPGLPKPGPMGQDLAGSGLPKRGRNGRSVPSREGASQKHHNDDPGIQSSGLWFLKIRDRPLTSEVFR